MHDFSCTNPEDMNYKELADRARYFKIDKEGQEVMCKIVEDIVKDFVTDEKKNAALRMIESGKLSLDEIAEFLDMPLDIVKSLVTDLQPA